MRRRHLTKLAFSTLGVIICAFLLSRCYEWRGPSGGSQATFTPPRIVNPADIAVPRGYTIEAVATGLTFPTGVDFDEDGHVYVLEAGYSYGEVWDTPRLLRLEATGQPTVIAVGENNGPWTGLAHHRGTFYVVEGGTLRGGRVLKVSRDGRMQSLISDLPSMGPHPAGGPALDPDGNVYFSVGTLSNAGVVGEDDAQFGWLPRFPHAHDIPCQTVRLTGENFTSSNPLTPDEDDTATTGAFVPFGTSTKKGQTIQGQIPCNGAVFRLSPTDGKLDLIAWGFRSAFGLAFSPDRRLYLTDNSYDNRHRGNRSVHGTGDLLWAVEPNTWYGWPDFHGQHPLDLGDFFIPPGKQRPPRLLLDPPNVPPPPSAVLDVHASATGFDFSRSASFGYLGEAFITLFGDQSPTSGKVLSPVGFKVVRVNVQTGRIEEFAVNRGHTNGPASRIGGGGLERPIAARFDPAGQALYVVDFGVMTVGQSKKLRGAYSEPHDPTEPRRGTGVLWRISRDRR